MAGSFISFPGRYRTSLAAGDGVSLAPGVGVGPQRLRPPLAVAGHSGQHLGDPPDRTKCMPCGAYGATLCQNRQKPGAGCVEAYDGGYAGRAVSRNR